MVVPQHGWFTMEHPIFGVAPFQEPLYGLSDVL